MKNEKQLTEFVHSGIKKGYTNFQYSTTYLGNYIVKDLYFTTDNHEIPDTDLKLSFETFRNKLQPGQKETWRIKVTGKNNALVAAELMASMYDASLDAFTASQNWGLKKFSPFDPNEYNDRYNFFDMAWRTNLDYHGSPYFRELDLKKYYQTCHYKENEAFSYPNLNTFGLTTYYYGYDESSYDDAGADEWGFSGETRTTSGTIEALQSSNKMLVRADEAELDWGIDAGDAEKHKFEELDKRMEAELPKNKVLKKSPLKLDEKADSPLTPAIQVRSNFNETAFFMPQLHTNEKGEVIIEFTIPESLTKWHFKALAHTKMMQSGILEKEDIVTQKDLMIFPNMPRFLREGDKITLATKSAI